MRKFIKLSAILFSAAAMLLAGVCGFVSLRMPGTISAAEDGILLPETALPLTLSKCGESVKTVNAAPHAGAYEAQVKLFGIIPVKKVSVKNTRRQSVVLCGTPFGVKIFTDGVMIVGITEISAEGAMRSPAGEAGLLTGDIIETVNGTRVYKNGEVAEIIEKSKGEKMEMGIRRGREKMSISFCAVHADDGTYKAGMWIRDSSAGIGTMTYIDPETGVFGGLGHGICDVDTGGIVPLSNGEVVGVALTGMTKSSPGSPGELRGFLADETVGNLKINNEIGVYGQVTAQGYSKTLYEVAFKQEIRRGKAQIITTIPGSAPTLYDIEIDKINYDEKSKSKNLVVKVTDKRLLKAAGGIVQGMSGSPIIQDGKFVGAVTHVFVNDPTLGYGIFAENMLEAAETLSAENPKEAG